jgi:hypothetical protein
MVIATESKTGTKPKCFLSDATSETVIWERQGLEGSASLLRDSLRQRVCPPYSSPSKQAIPLTFPSISGRSLLPPVEPQTLTVLAEPTVDGQ